MRIIPRSNTLTLAERLRLITEREAERPLRLTLTQQYVLLTVMQDTDPQSAFRQISTGGRKLLTAADMLSQLNVITLGDDSVEITEYGNQILQDEGLTDESGQMTDKGQEILASDPSQEQQSKGPEEDMGSMDDLGGLDDLGGGMGGAMDDLGSPEDGMGMDSEPALGSGGRDYEGSPEQKSAKRKLRLPSMESGELLRQLFALNEVETKEQRRLRTIRDANARDKERSKVKMKKCPECDGHGREWGGGPGKRGAHNWSVRPPCPMCKGKKVVPISAQEDEEGTSKKHHGSANQCGGRRGG